MNFVNTIIVSSSSLIYDLLRIVQFVSFLRPGMWTQQFIFSQLTNRIQQLDHRGQSSDVPLFILNKIYCDICKSFLTSVI